MSHVSWCLVTKYMIHNGMHYEFLVRVIIVGYIVYIVYVRTDMDDWLIWFLVFNTTQQNFSYIMATSFSDGRSRSTRREPPTMGK